MKKSLLIAVLGALAATGCNDADLVGGPTPPVAVITSELAAYTTLDTATRLQRYVITELGGAIGIRPLRNKYVATTVAVVAGGAIAMIPGAVGPGSGGLILWPIFGATNQLLAGLSFMVIAFYLLRHNRPVWFLVLPMILMIVLPNWAMVHQMRSWWSNSQWLLLALGAVVSLLEIWMVIEAALMWTRVRGIAPVPLPLLPSQAKVSTSTVC